jgi:hypothetical protein
MLVFLDLGSLKPSETVDLLRSAVYSSLQRRPASLEVLCLWHKEASYNGRMKKLSMTRNVIGEPFVSRITRSFRLFSNPDGYGVPHECDLLRNAKSENGGLTLLGSQLNTREMWHCYLVLLSCFLTYKAQHGTVILYPCQGIS